MKTLRAFTAALRIQSPYDITPAAIQDYMVRRRADGRSNKTVSNERGHIGRFCRFLIQQGDIDQNPVARTSAPKLPTSEPIHLSRAELGRALRVAHQRGLWAVFFAAYGGFRLGELKRLKWSDLRQGRDGSILVVRESKTNRPRSVPVSKRLAHAIKRMLAGTPEELIFSSRSEHEWARYLAPIKKVVPKMNRSRGGWHDFRRTFGSLLVQAGTPIYTVSKLLGHSQISTTAKFYAHLDAESGRADIEKL